MMPSNTQMQMLPEQSDVPKTKMQRESQSVASLVAK